MNSSTPLHERIAEIAGALTPSEAQVAAFIAANPAVVAVSSTAELGTYTSTSDATVVRTSKKLGYANFRELRRSALAISVRHRDPSKVLDDQLGQISGSSFGVKQVFRDTADLLGHLAADLDMESWNRAVTAISGAARVIAYGTGPSGCMADYLSFALTRTGIRSTSVKVTGLALADHLLDIRDGDVVIVFATMRRFKEIDVVIGHANDAGATVILVTETLGVALREQVDVVLATPTTTTGTSDGVLIGMIIARALELSVASQDQANAVHTMQRLNALRAEIVGGKVDTDG